jgi:hypothetical protein
MSSTYNDIRAAIEGRIATQMAIAPVYPVSYQKRTIHTTQQHTMAAGVSYGLVITTTLRCCLLVVLALTGRMAPWW